MDYWAARNLRPNDQVQYEGIRGTVTGRIQLGTSDSGSVRIKWDSEYDEEWIDWKDMEDIDEA